MLIKNSEYLQADTHVEDIPELIYERKELEELKTRITGYFNGIDIAFTRLLSGPSGSGKTVSILYILYNFIKQNPQFTKDFIYINGTQVRSPKSMFTYLSTQLGVQHSETNISTLAESIEHAMNESQRRKLIIIDEVDKIYKNSRESPKYLFLHTLNRLNIKPRHSILMITNDFNLTKNFNSELTGSLLETVFDAYSADDILKILKLRATYCLNSKSFVVDDLAKIAREANQNPIGGDRANIRHALNILQQAATMAQDKGKIIAEVLDDAIEVVRVDNYVKLLKKYNKHLVCLIQVLCELKKKHSVGIYKFANPDIDYDDIKNNFFKLLDTGGTRVISEAQFRKYIEQLVNENLLRRINRARYSFLDDAESILQAIIKMNKPR